MNAITAPKSSAQNRLEGFALTAIFQGLPTFAAAVLMLKVVGAAIFVVLAALVYAAVTPWLVSKFPILFRKASEPVFFDANLSVSDKVAQWLKQPQVSLQLVTTVIMLSLLAVAVASMG
ncbi:hypothetical protein UP10_26660 [Bradyrhizobium sp. LTSPM299]|uniref:hypothetical protein n=1 Tax=Bradyrhizobium sp. LTSPM299 TaxID=1619233 RepID=UPI0005C8093D|nr:hypothetical protein [Bradyrhizobium sp. LTSPM299]KJC57791.1 hypothetical protein UP10_26660 [Bradyrhizobium sp. LTSPM299]